MNYTFKINDKSGNDLFSEWSNHLWFQSTLDPEPRIKLCNLQNLTFRSANGFEIQDKLVFPRANMGNQPGNQIRHSVQLYKTTTAGQIIHGL
jgi:hypothetical protein